MRYAIGILMLLLGSEALVRAGDGYKPGWSADGIAEASASCTEGLVKGAWENTKREQGVDPSTEMTPEIRKQLEPQIKGMASLCDCAIKQAARKYRPAEAHDPGFEKFVVGLVKSGRCKLPN